MIIIISKSNLNIISGHNIYNHYTKNLYDYTTIIIIIIIIIITIIHNDNYYCYHN